jgi:transposase
VDEASVQLNGSVRRWVTRKDGDAYPPECMLPSFASGRQSCMVWGAIWHGGRSELICFDQSESTGKRGGVTAVMYRDQITKQELKRNWQHLSTRWRGYGTPRIVEDGARVHTAQVNRLVGEQQHFRYLNHPPSSPDLNAVEHCWAAVKRKYALLPRHPTTVDTMFEEYKRLWQEIPQEDINNMIDSMPKQLKAVRKCRGWSTKYQVSCSLFWRSKLTLLVSHRHCFKPLALCMLMPYLSADHRLNNPFATQHSAT